MICYGIDMAQQLLENLITQFNTLGLIISINGGDRKNFMTF